MLISAALNKIIEAVRFLHNWITNGDAFSCEDSRDVHQLLFIVICLNIFAMGKIAIIYSFRKQNRLGAVNRFKKRKLTFYMM